MPKIDIDDLTRFFQRYARTSLGPEPDKLASFYDDSFVAAGPKGAAAFRNDSSFLEWLRQVSGFNRAAGMTSMEVVSVDSMPIGNQYALATVSWAATFRKTGDEPIRFSISYLLREAEEGLKVLAYVSHEDQEEKMKEFGLL